MKKYDEKRASKSKKECNVNLDLLEAEIGEEATDKLEIMLSCEISRLNMIEEIRKNMEEKGKFVELLKEFMKK